MKRARNVRSHGASAALLMLVLVACSSDASTTEHRDASTCASPPCTCTARELACSDAVDDDCDGVTDCVDVDCSGSAVCASHCVPRAESSAAACSNHLDDDCDGHTDCGDGDCRGTGNAACLGRSWAGRCTTLVPEGYVDSIGLGVQLTASGIRANATYAGGYVLEIETIGATAPTSVSFLTPPDDDRATCTRCFLLRNGSKTYYPRSGTADFTLLPTHVGEPFAGGIAATFEEVTLVGQHVVPVASGKCMFVRWNVRGAAVSSVPTSGSGALMVTLGEGGFAQGTEPPTGCGDGACFGTETMASCTDCACSAGGKVCPDGHTCPVDSICLNHGRCQCAPDHTPLACDSGGFCGSVNASCETATAWDCVPLRCGITNFAVRCPNGGTCPVGSTCSGAYCVCNAGSAPYDCSGDVCNGTNCTGASWECKPTQPDCGAVNFSLACTRSSSCPAHGGCGASGECYGCAAGYVPVGCDGVRCSSESLSCAGWSWHCVPEASAPWP